MTAAQATGARRATTIAIVVAATIAIVVALGVVRRAIIMSWFTPATVHAFELRDAPPGGPKSARVRVILLDGLGFADARKLEGLDRVCARGRDFVVDVGFPTVSLPVQHALWTGLTQQQTGVAFSNRRIDPPPSFTIPARVASVAVAESHGEIARSFGFGEVLAPPDQERDAQWDAGGFAQAAQQALTGPIPLAFVHVLAVDDAGHAHGRDSPEYRDAASQAAAHTEIWIPSELVDTEIWLVLADHGHLETGGHGGAEPDLRHVRACLVTGSSVDARVPERARLIDVSASLAEWLGVPTPVDARGVPLHRLAATTESELPRVDAIPLVIAAAMVAVALYVGHRSTRLPWLLPWWLALAYASFAVLHGVPTLSLGPVFPRYGGDALLAAMPGGLVALVAARTAVARGHTVALVWLALMLAPLTGWVAVVLSSGSIATWFGDPIGPVIIPYVSAHASVVASLVQVGAVGCGLGVVLGVLRSTDRS